MAAGPYAVDGVEDAGRGTEAATRFLERLRAVADVHDVVALQLRRTSTPTRSSPRG